MILNAALCCRKDFTQKPGTWLLACLVHTVSYSLLSLPVLVTDPLTVRSLT